MEIDFYNKDRNKQINIFLDKKMRELFFSEKSLKRATYLYDLIQKFSRYFGVDPVAFQNMTVREVLDLIFRNRAIVAYESLYKEVRDTSWEPVSEIYQQFQEELIKMVAQYVADSEKRFHDVRGESSEQ
jgi:hypothetical protein